MINLNVKIVTFAVVSLLLSCANIPEAQGNEKVTIITFGDSIIYGPYAPGSYQNQIDSLLLTRYPKKSFLLPNEGTKGLTTFEAVGLVQAAIKRYPDAKYIFISIGINDVRKFLLKDPSKFNSVLGNFQQLISVAKTNNLKVIVSNILPMEETNNPTPDKPATNKIVSALNEKLEVLCKKEKVDFYIESSFTLIFNNKKYYKDTLHPSLEGYRLLARLFVETVRF